jgi:Tol biopolymer transport system component
MVQDTLTRLTFGGDDNLYSAWAPDGKKVAFSSNREGPISIFWQPSDGSGSVERLTTGENTDYPSSFSPDGQLLVFTDANPSTGFDIWILRLNDRKTQPFIQASYNQGGARFSPDGHWLAYISDESGRYEVYVQPYPGPGGKYQISTEGGTEPVWNRNGKELFYRSGDKMMTVEVTTQPNFLGREDKGAVRRTVCAVSSGYHAFLRRIRRWPAVSDDQGERRGYSTEANRRGAELV